MYLANASLAFEGTHEVFVQIGHDDYELWVDVDVFETAVARIMRTLTSCCGDTPEDYEIPLIADFDEPVNGPRRVITGVTGRVDVAYGETSIEMKFCTCLSDLHELQNLMYAAMNCITYGRGVGCSTLYNARTEGRIIHEIDCVNAWRLLREAARMKVL